jgi:hypothetical protein
MRLHFLGFSPWGIPTFLFGRAGIHVGAQDRVQGSRRARFAVARRFNGRERSAGEGIVKTSGQSLIPQAMPPNLCHLEHRLNKRERVRASAKDPRQRFLQPNRFREFSRPFQTHDMPSRAVAQPRHIEFCRLQCAQARERLRYRRRIDTLQMHLKKLVVRIRARALAVP